jgi:hypothetical protein
MRHTHHHQDQHPQPPTPPAPAAAKPTQAALDQGAANFTPSPDEVARRAYFSYVNQGSRPGHEVQHWLKAETDILAERKLTRTHGFHNPT